MEFKYMLLGRLETDVNYYLGYGNKNPDSLYYKDVKTHIREMINLWKSLPVKPEWLRASKLIEYKKQLLSN